MFDLRQLRQPVLPRLPTIWFSLKISYCLLWDDNSLMSTCDMSKNERIISIFETFMTKFHELPKQPSYQYFSCVYQHLQCVCTVFIYEPRHEKMRLREFQTRSGLNWPAQPQKLA